ncbi:uncharacterized protein [Tiliqua scincoides]|uniref:uncharacterized protein n=1 Tax=Tiliqua scincoides TaxID=71010 RepID=UPI0034626033
MMENIYQDSGGEGGSASAALHVPASKTPGASRPASSLAKPHPRWLQAPRRPAPRAPAGRPAITSGARNGRCPAGRLNSEARPGKAQAAPRALSAPGARRLEGRGAALPPERRWTRARPPSPTRPDSPLPGGGGGPARRQERAGGQLHLRPAAKQAPPPRAGRGALQSATPARPPAAPGRRAFPGHGVPQTPPLPTPPSPGGRRVCLRLAHRGPPKAGGPPLKRVGGPSEGRVLLQGEPSAPPTHSPGPRPAKRESLGRSEAGFEITNADRTSQHPRLPLARAKPAPAPVLAPRWAVRIQPLPLPADSAAAATARRSPGSPVSGRPRREAAQAVRSQGAPSESVGLPPGALRAGVPWRSPSPATLPGSRPH